MSMSTTPVLPTTSSPGDIRPDPPLHIPIVMSDLLIGGSILLTLSVIFTFVNGFLIWLAFFKNWTAITRSKFFNSFFLGLVLSVTDLVLAVFVGFPASLHLTWMSYFRMQPSMPFYSMYVGHFLFVFIFNFRVLIVALMSLDSFFHIMFPFLYEAGYESRRKVHIACIIVAAIPIILKIAPAFFFLWEHDGKLSCLQYKDPNATSYDESHYRERYYVPLTCYISLPNGKHDIVRADVAISATIIVVSWFILISTNIACLLIAMRRLRNSPARTSITQTARATLLICSISFTFMLSNFPNVVVALMSNLATDGYEFAKAANVTNKVKFYITLLSFLSLIFHPWFFVLRLKSFRELLIRFKMKVMRSVRASQRLPISSVSIPATTNRTRLDTDKSSDSIELKKLGEQVVLANRSASEETV